MSPRIWPPLVDWTSSKHWDFDAAETNDPQPCVLCGKPSLLLSDDGKPCHKACAEAWYEQHPEAWALFEKKRDEEAERKRKKKAKAKDTKPIETVVADALFDKAA